MAQNPDQGRASATVAKWLASNYKNPVWLAETAKVDPGTVGDFLNGLRWPKLKTQGKIEAALGWPPGTIHQLGLGMVEVTPELTERRVVGGDVQDAGYVAAPGDRVSGGAADDEVLESIRAMREDMRAMRVALERLADR